MGTCDASEDQTDGSFFIYQPPNKRLLWWVISVLLAGIIVIVIPVQQIQIAGARLEGTIGSYYTSGGIAITSSDATGTATASYSRLWTDYGQEEHAYVDYEFLLRPPTGSTNAALDFSTVGGNLGSSVGDLTSLLYVQAEGSNNFTYNPFAIQADIKNRSMKFTFDYVPGEIFVDNLPNGSSYIVDPNDTPPANLSVYMAYTLSGSAYAAGSQTYDYPTMGSISGSATSSGSVTIDGNTLTFPTASATYPAPAASLSATQDYDAVYTVPFSSGHLDLPIATSAHISTQGSKAATGSTNASANARPRPIRLTDPYAGGHPEKGTGVNQFTYVASEGVAPHLDFAKGNLFIPITTTLINGSTAETARLRSRITWATDILEPSASFTPTAVANTILPSTTFSTPGASPRNGFIFEGLPIDNKSFGDHTITQTVNGQTSDVAHIQTFFQGDAANYPNNTPPPTVINDDKTTFQNPHSPPNWWYYYEEVYPKPTDCSYQSSGMTQTIPGTGHIYLNYGALNPYKMPVFKLNAGTIQWVGQLHFTGVYTYIYCCGHESAHRAHMQAGIETGGLHTDPTQADYIPDHDRDGGYSSQNGGDGVSDAYEISHHLNQNIADTTLAYEGTDEASTGDSELLADIDALGILIAHKDAWKQDWAEPTGCRWGKLPWPMDKPQWTFTPFKGFDAAMKPIFGPGTPDLPPGLLTSISQLN